MSNEGKNKGGGDAPLRTVALLAPWVDSRGIARDMEGQQQPEGRIYAVGKRIQLPEDEALQLEAQRRVVWAPMPKPGGGKKEPEAKPSGPDLPLDVNEATAEQLGQLDQLSDAKAKAIVEHREKHGAFTSISIDGDDQGLTAVKGIGKGIATKLADGILVVNQPEKLNVNEATAEQLQEIDSIGKEIADAIVAHVKANAPFTSIAQTDDDAGLTVIPGIARETAQELAEHMTV